MKGRLVYAMKVAVAFIALAFCAAPVPGDVGGCGQEAKPLDPEVFFWSFQRFECDGCRQCALDSKACQRACGDVLLETEFPKDCVPLVHDGEVCLRAVQAGSCADFSDYMSDTAPSIPTECNFCPAQERR